MADVYNALLSDRVYRAGLPLDEVIKIMKNERGRKFDPELLDLFCVRLDDLRQFCETAECYLDAAPANRNAGCV